MTVKQVREELAGDNFALLAALPSVHDQLVVKLADVVPERGDALWLRFTQWRDTQPDEGGDTPFTKWVGVTLLPALMM